MFSFQAVFSWTQNVQIQLKAMLFSFRTSLKKLCYKNSQCQKTNILEIVFLQKYFIKWHKKCDLTCASYLFAEKMLYASIGKKEDKKHKQTGPKLLLACVHKIYTN